MGLHIPCLCVCVCFFYGAKEFKGLFETVTKAVPVPNTFPAETDMVWSLEVHRGVLKKINSTVKVYRIKHSMNALYRQSVSVPVPDVLAIFTFFKI